MFLVVMEVGLMMGGSGCICCGGDECRVLTEVFYKIQKNSQNTELQQKVEKSESKFKILHQVQQYTIYFCTKICILKHIYFRHSTELSKILLQN